MLPAGFGVLGGVICLLGSWIPSLWGDEAASLMSAERPLGSLFMMLRHVDAVHGTYYLGLHAWVRLVGTSPFAIRLPSALAAGLCAAAVVILARRLSTTATAVVAGTVCVLLPRITYAGAEARSYAFSAAIAAWLTVILVELMLRKAPARHLWAFYGALLALGIYVFLYVGLIAAAHALVMLCTRVGRSFVLRWGVTVGSALLVAAPIMVWAYVERGQVSYLEHRTEVTTWSILVSLWFGRPLYAIVAWSVIVIGLLILLVRWFTRHGGARMYRLESVAACWLAVPSVLLIGTSFALSDFTARYLTFCAPAAVILIASGITRIARALASSRLGILIVMVLAVVVAAAAIPEYVAQRQPYAQNNSDWAEISGVVGAHASEGDAIVFDDSVRPSRRPRLALHTYPAGFETVADVLLKVPFTRNTSWSDTTYAIAQAADRGRLNHVSRLWLVEYATPAHVDTWGQADLRALGYTVTARYRDYRSEVFELLKVGEWTRRFQPSTHGGQPTVSASARGIW
jgi:mannosyltransferase